MGQQQSRDAVTRNHWAVAAVAIVSLGCSSTKAGPDAGDSGGACADKNPAGVCYPTANQGFSQRMGALAGNRIPNFTFQGSLNLDPKTKTSSTAELTTIRLSDFYDPEGKKFRTIRLIAASSWCGPCRMEIDFISMPGGLSETLGPQGAILIQTLLDGLSAGTPATVQDLRDWIKSTQPNITQVLDPGGMQMGVFGSRTLLPFSVTIDARSMEILSKDTGYTDGQKLEDDVKAWLMWTMTNPPLQ